MCFYKRVYHVPSRLVVESVNNLVNRLLAIAVDIPIASPLTPAPHSPYSGGYGRHVHVFILITCVLIVAASLNYQYQVAHLSKVLPTAIILQLPMLMHQLT